MIENITVLCTHKEDRQQWIDLLSQEQGLGLLRSPTVMPHVSCPHPPFTRLSRYYARLVRKKIIHPELMKKLLYLQYIYKPDLGHVKMRKCTVTYNIFPTNSQDCQSETSSLASDCERPIEKKKRPLHKSTLLLDVRYVFGDPPLDAQKLQIPPSSSSLLAVMKSNSCEDHYSLDTSKSLPATVTSSQCFAPNLDATHYRDFRNENLNETIDLRFGQDNCKNWKSLDQSQRNLIETTQEDWPKSFNEIAADSQFIPTTSLWSSDSGMADSCHFNSSEMNSCYKLYSNNRGGKTIDLVRTSHSESENDENKFEYQCICSSPFGSTPRESEQFSDLNTFVSRWGVGESSVNIGNEEIDFDDSSRKSNDSEGVEESAAAFSHIALVDDSDDNVDYNDVHRKRYSQPIPCAHQNIAKKAHRHNNREKQESDNHPQGNQVYTSGLYAHWWLKKAIPLPETTDEGKLP